MTSQYQWLLFDADGTLFDFDRAEDAALREVFKCFGTEFTTAHHAAYQRINQTLWQAVEKGSVSLGLVKIRRFELLFEETGVPHSPTAFSARYLECLADRSELIQDAAETLDALGEKYRMAILTNGVEFVQRRRLARSEIKRHFSEIIISEEIGHAKPAQEYFAAALARLGNPPARSALMIGDSWNSDILGATRYGLDACWYNPRRDPRPAGARVTREIACLRELVEWLAPE